MLEYLLANRVILIGILVLLFGAVLLWAYVTRHHRSLRDALSLLLGGGLLTGLLLLIVLYFQRLPLSTPWQLRLSLIAFFAVALGISWTFNKFRKFR